MSCEWLTTGVYCAVTCCLQTHRSVKAAQTCSTTETSTLNFWTAEASNNGWKQQQLALWCVCGCSGIWTSASGTFWKHIWERWCTRRKKASRLTALQLYYREYFQKQHDRFHKVSTMGLTSVQYKCQHPFLFKQRASLCGIGRLTAAGILRESSARK